MSARWTPPSVGDIVWCLFPELPDMAPGPKPRPALVLSVEGRDDGVLVKIAYGTSKNVDRLKTGELAITLARHPAAYKLAGLAYDTKFDFKVIVDLAWSDRYFKIPSASRHGQTPKIGTLHASIHRAVESAYRAAIAR